jgi:hypothetical protein
MLAWERWLTARRVQREEIPTAWSEEVAAGNTLIFARPKWRPLALASTLSAAALMFFWAALTESSEALPDRLFGVGLGLLLLALVIRVLSRVDQRVEIDSGGIAIPHRHVHLTWAAVSGAHVMNVPFFNAKQPISISVNGDLAKRGRHGLLLPNHLRVNQVLLATWIEDEAERRRPAAGSPRA